jgi:hypothetical protein
MSAPILEKRAIARVTIPSTLSLIAVESWSGQRRKKISSCGVSDLSLQRANREPRAANLLWFQPFGRHDL